MDHATSSQTGTVAANTAGSPLSLDDNHSRDKICIDLQLTPFTLPASDDSSTSANRLQPHAKSLASFDDLLSPSSKQHVELKTVSVGRGRRFSITKSKLMSTSYGQPNDPSTVPDQAASYKLFPAPPSRSQSATGDRHDGEVELIENAPAAEVKALPRWLSRQAASHQLAERVCAAIQSPSPVEVSEGSIPQLSSKNKLALTIDVETEDKPLPPPPKSSPLVPSSSSETHTSMTEDELTAALAIAKSERIKKKKAAKKKAMRKSMKQSIRAHTPSETPETPCDGTLESYFAQPSVARLSAPFQTPTPCDGTLEDYCQQDYFAQPSLVEVPSADADSVTKPAPEMPNEVHVRDFAAKKTSTSPAVKTTITKSKPDTAGETIDTQRPVQSSIPEPPSNPPPPPPSVQPLESNETMHRTSSQDSTQPSRSDTATSTVTAPTSVQLPEPDRATSPTAAPTSIPSQPSNPDIFKPMPSLPLSSWKLRSHLREVRDAEVNKDLKASDLSNSELNSVPIQLSHISDLYSPNKKERAGHNNPFSRSPVKQPKNASKADLKTIAQDRKNRPTSPENIVEAGSSGKNLPALPHEAGSRAVTPDIKISSRVVTPDLTLIPEHTSASADPAQTIADITAQSEALHTRFSTLRAERVKLSASISAILKQKESIMQNADSLLDQHLALNAVNSSMEICFAKLKSLEYTKDEAVSTLIAQAKAGAASWRAKHQLSARSNLPLSLTRSGRSTPEIIEPRSTTPLLRSGRSTPDTAESRPVSPEIGSQPTFSSMVAPVETARNLSPERKSERQAAAEPAEATHDKDRKAKKRITMISVMSPAELAAETDDISSISPMSAEFPASPKRIRIKGAKAVKVLGLVAQSAKGGSDKLDITLPDALPPLDTSTQRQMVVDVVVKPGKRVLKPDLVLSPATEAPSCPIQPPPPTPTRRKRQSTGDSTGSAASSSQAESSPEDDEVSTPRAEVADPLQGLTREKVDMLPTIEVVVDDDILDYYRGATFY